jgi:hypothetical protein
MPSTVLSHQGIVLPLKIRYPNKFDGTALCVGSIVPDITFILTFFLGSHFNAYYLFHSIAGLVYTIPFSLFLVILLNRVFFPIIDYIASKGRF